ncbi:hypothetical protein EYF80_025589 [Liparis tanakae]|uniref:Uncharacterized protein n=1 Tax=Liparis tanakae TaxID=230148 RepID=A0A4Z2HF34_9TELE|nr:hypothetical protein EYF80_025589 [Liparis tanakae]
MSIGGGERAAKGEVFFLTDNSPRVRRPWLLCDASCPVGRPPAVAPPLLSTSICFMDSGGLDRGFAAPSEGLQEKRRGVTATVMSPICALPIDHIRDAGRMCRHRIEKEKAGRPACSLNAAL